MSAPNKHDDGSISDDSSLLRRVAPEQYVDDDNLGRRRPSSAAFKQIELSVDSEPLLQSQGLDWRFTLKEYPTHSLVRLRASLPRSLGLAVVHVPLDGNPAHVEIIGKKSQSVAMK